MRKLIAVLVFCVTSIASGQRNADTPEALVRAMAERLVATAHLPGLSVAVSKDGKIIFAEGFGFADVEARRRVTPETRFRTASVGKVIAATGLALLVQDGRLDLDAPVQKYVPAFPEKGWPITSRQLAGHTAGVPHYNDSDRMERRFYPSVTDALGVFSHEPLRAEPETAYGYSTHGFTLLSAVIEGAAKQPFLEYMQRAVFNPLGMRSTGPDLRAKPNAAMATFYQWRDSALTRVAAPEDPSYKWAGGGLTSTPSDLLRVGNAYLDGFVKPDVVKMMWTSQRLRSGRETAVGIAWRNGRDVAGRETIEHAGSMEGARTVVCIFPKERIVVALMTNREWSSTVEETAHMMALPFIEPASPIVQRTLSVPATVSLLAVSGQKTAHAGTLALEGGRGSLTIDPGTKDAQSYPLIYLGRCDVYALVRPDGIYHVALAESDGTINGRVIAYGSQRLTSPAGNPPFITFEAKRP